MASVRGLCVAWALVVCACTSLGRPPPAPPRHAQLDLTITSYLLGNGLKVVLVKDPRAAEVQVTMRYQVGSVDDPVAHPGMAHLVEHLLYEQLIGDQTLLAAFEEVTTGFNAYTTFDATTYVSRAEPGKLRRLLELESHRLEKRCGSVSGSVFAREREVVANELRQRDQATEILSTVHLALYPAGHPYQRPVGGSVESVTSITRDQACAFADAHYAPNNAALVVSGNLDAAAEQMILNELLAKSPTRKVVAAVPIHQVPFQPWFVQTTAPLDDNAVLIAWPLPTGDPRVAAKVRAVATAIANLVDSEVPGQVAPIELGDTRAPMVGVAVFAAPGETKAQLRAGVERGVAKLPTVLDRADVSELGDLQFGRIQQTAIYRAYASLEDGGDRDTRLATMILSGGDPRVMFDSELAGLRELTRPEASFLAREYLSLPRSKVLELDAAPGKKRGNRVALETPIHDRGQRRRLPDVADASRPAPAAPTSRAIAGMTTRKLANGLDVVLLPLTSVPTVELRLVFGSGAADEPAGKRGLAHVAAKALTWDLRYINDLVMFAAAGGTNLSDVATDRTTFAAHGVDMHLDVLLTGLRRWVIDGKYDESVDDVLNAMQRERMKVDDDGPFTDAWRTAVFGARHPYVKAGLPRHASTTLAPVDAQRFASAYYTPDNATLVIAGRFDPRLADQWIDYLFSDWTGRAVPRRSPRASAQPVSIARVEDLSQLQLRVAIPAAAGARAEQLVAAEMLAEIAGDVRHQLGASYGLTAALAEQRLSQSYVIGGWIDAARAAAAVQLLRDRIAKLRAGGDDAARSFVVARNRVLLRLGSVTGSAASLAARVERDTELDRAPMADLATAQAVQALTIDRMGGALAELDLQRAAIAMLGPAAEMKQAFAVLGRTPVEVGVAVAPEVDAPGEVDTLPPAPRAPRLEWLIGAGFRSATIERQLATSSELVGLPVVGRIGYRANDLVAIGGHLGGSLMRGNEESALQMEAGGYLQVRADPWWGSLHAGLTHTRVFAQDDMDRDDTGFLFGAVAGFDFRSSRRGAWALYVGLDGTPLDEYGFASFTIGLAMRTFAR